MNATHALFDEVGEDPTIDKFFDANPRDVDMAAVIKHFRKERAQFIDGKGKGRAKAAATPEETTDGE